MVEARTFSCWSLVHRRAIETFHQDWGVSKTRGTKVLTLVVVDVKFLVRLAGETAIVVVIIVLVQRQIASILACRSVPRLVLEALACVDRG